MSSEKELLSTRNPGNEAVPKLPYLEGVDSYVYPPSKEGIGGACASDYAPVYRVFRGPTRFPDDANHRFTTDVALYSALIALGWDDEGVKFCVEK